MIAGLAPLLVLAGLPAFAGDAYADRALIAIADILGDWREEIITSIPGGLRIYTTTIPTTRRHVWLMEDSIYRNDVSRVAMGYLYPPLLTKVMTAETKL